MKLTLKYRDLLVFFVAGVLTLSVWYFLTHRGEPFQPVFYGEGHLTKDTEGLLPGVWYLVYDEPGFANLSLPLTFDAESVCGIEKKSVCGSLLVGDRVFVEGVHIDEDVLVHKLTFVDPKTRSQPVRLYYYNPAIDVDAKGNILCSAKGLVPVERILPHTEEPLVETIRLLLRGDVHDDEKARGLSSEFPLFGVRLERASVLNSTAIISLDDPHSATAGGACETAVMRAQIEATAKQFSDVRQVRIEPSTLFRR